MICIGVFWWVLNLGQNAAAALDPAAGIVKSKTPTHGIGKRRPRLMTILTQEHTDNLDGVLLGQRALDLALTFHSATINAGMENVQHYLWGMGRPRMGAIDIPNSPRTSMPATTEITTEAK